MITAVWAQRLAVCLAYEIPDPQAVLWVLRRHGALVPVLRDAPDALARFFPDAPLRLDVDGDSLVLVVQVPDPLEALCGPLLEFDRAWWYALVPRCGGHLTIDVEGC